MFSNQFNSLKLISNCPVCKKKQFPADITLINEKDEQHLFHVKCKSCASCLLVYANFGEQGVNVIGVLTDLHSKEVDSFLAKGSLTADEIIEIHSNINNKKFLQEICN